MKNTEKKTHQTSMFEPEFFQVEFKLEEGEMKTTRKMTLEECQDFIDFLDVFAIKTIHLKIKKHENNCQTPDDHS